jgi:hypothetical protein
MTARLRKGRHTSTRSRRKSSADRPRQTSIALKEEPTMDLPPQAARVMRGHDRGRPALPPYNEGLVVGQSALPCTLLCALLPAPYNAICQKLCPIIP